MNYLIIDTTTEYLNIAYKTADKSGFYSDASPLKHSRTLMPAIDGILGESRLSAIDCIGVVIGPGSFTGIRIGVTTAKAFNFADPRIKLVGINSLRTKIMGVDVSQAEYAISIIDGGNKVCYVAVYSESTEILPPCALAVSELNIFLKSVTEPCIIMGDVKDIELPANIICKKSDAQKGLTSAFNEAVSKGLFLNHNGLEPLYIQVSQAEKNFRG